MSEPDLSESNPVWDEMRQIGYKEYLIDGIKDMSREDPDQYYKWTRMAGVNKAKMDLTKLPEDVQSKIVDDYGDRDQRAKDYADFNWNTYLKENKDMQDLLFLV